MKQLPLDWIHANYKGFKKVGFKELIVALDRAPHESLFGTELVVTLCRHFWDFYYRRIFFFGFLPYLLYFISTLLYVSWYAVEGISRDELYTFSGEFVLRSLMILCIVYFAFFEFTNLFRDPYGYIGDPFNLVDWIEFILNGYILWHLVRDDIDETESTEPAVSPVADSGGEKKEPAMIDLLGNDIQTIRSMAAISVGLMWIKSFYWMRLFDKTSFYIRLIQETLSEVAYFAILFVFILFCFANTIFVINQGRIKDGYLYANVFEQQFFDSVIDQYLLALGE